MFLRHELISDDLVEKISGWRHSGFSVHSKVRAQIRKEAERMGKDMIRPLLSLERLSFSEKEGQGIYRYGESSEEIERMDYLEFIARVPSHIPDKGQVTIRYSGLCANAHRGQVRKTEAGEHKLLRIEEECPRIRLPRLGLSANGLGRSAYCSECRNISVASRLSRIFRPWTRSRDIHAGAQYSFGASWQACETMSLERAELPGLLEPK